VKAQKVVVTPVHGTLLSFRVDHGYLIDSERLREDLVLVACLGPASRGGLCVGVLVVMVAIQKKKKKKKKKKKEKT